MTTLAAPTGHPISSPNIAPPPDYDFPDHGYVDPRKLGMAHLAISNGPATIIFDTVQGNEVLPAREEPEPRMGPTVVDRGVILGGHQNYIHQVTGLNRPPISAGKS